MNADQRVLDDTIRDAVVEHGTAIDVSVPDFGAILSGRQRHTRRLLASATIAVALIGIVGVVLASNRADAPRDAVSEAPTRSDIDADPDTSPQPSAGSATTVLPRPSATMRTIPVEYACTDPIGEDQLGRQLFGACEPALGEVDGDYACTDRIGTEDGFVIFSDCEPVGQLGPVPGDSENDAPFDNPGDVPVRRTPYVVQAGDYGLKVAAEFCVSVVDLEAVNGWTDNTREFPFPGSEILIPAGDDASTCDVGSYTITTGDTSRIAVADKFCIGVQALDAANLETPGYDSFFPGLAIIIPPSSSTTC